MKGGDRANDTFAGFWVVDSTMLERFERDVWETRNDCFLGFIYLLFLSDVPFFEIERR